jgi:hypothetical protein
VPAADGGGLIFSFATWLFQCSYCQHLLVSSTCVICRFYRRCCCVLLVGDGVVDLLLLLLLLLCIRTCGPYLTWYVPLGLKAWFTRVGIHNVKELDWWQEVEHPGGKVRRPICCYHWCLRPCYTRNTEQAHDGVVHISPLLRA